MKLRISDKLILKAYEDVSRPHSCAFERVGYFSGQDSNSMSELSISNWLGFEDEMYEDSPEVGARIGRKGMKFLMSQALRTQHSYIHFHLHEFQRSPEFSYVDLKSINEIIPALFRFSKAKIHGALIMGSEEYTSILWSRDKETPVKQSFEISKYLKEKLYERKK